MLTHALSASTSLQASSDSNASTPVTACNQGGVSSLRLPAKQLLLGLGQAEDTTAAASNANNKGMPAVAHADIQAHAHIKNHHTICCQVNTLDQEQRCHAAAASYLQPAWNWIKVQVREAELTQQQMHQYARAALDQHLHNAQTSDYQ
jgi:hypothetical protein